MNRIYLTIIIATIHVVSFGQKKGLDKNVIVTEKLIGSWKFDYAIFRASLQGTTSIDTGRSFHIDTLHFFRDMTYRFRSYNISDNSARIHTGIWEIVKRGKRIVHKKRVAQPPFEEPSPDLTFPIRVINKDRIRIDYIVIYVQFGTEATRNRTPVFFNRIK